MGLDWNPGPKPKLGCEAEFESLWHRILSTPAKDQNPQILNANTQRFKEITIPPFDTLAAPTVGVDAAATDWVRAQLEKRTDKSLTEEQFVKAFSGFRVLSLVPPCDGLPRYTNGAPGAYVEAYAFRGQFLRDCTEIIGDELLESAFESKLPSDTIAYGNALLARAVIFAEKSELDLQAVHSSDDPESIGFHLDVVVSAGRWCTFWGGHGHWLEAYW